MWSMPAAVGVPFGPRPCSIRAAFISNKWRPDRVNAIGLGLQQGTAQIGFDLLANMRSEFWPDVKRKMFRHKPIGVKDAPEGFEEQVIKLPLLSYCPPVYSIRLPSTPKTIGIELAILVACGESSALARYRLLREGYSVCLVFLKLFERIYAPLTAGLLSPVSADSKLQERSQLDRLYQRVIDDLGKLMDAVGLKAA